MFQEALLESAPLGRKRKRWPMAAAVTLEAIVCGALIALPLFSSGVILVAARPPVPVPLDEPPRIAHRPPEAHPSGGGRGTISHVEVVSFATNQVRPCLLNCPERAKDNDISVDTTFSATSRELPSELASCASCRGAGPVGPARISTLTPGALVYRVEPVYPRPAAITLTRGVVRLHAIIGTDGTIQSLKVIEGPPLLIDAAREAVRQWRYRPYILNGRPVEVETIITVNFKGPD
jgi:periplasmic protein TonB